MSFPSQLWSKRKGRNRRSLRGLMLLLCLAMWRGPIPCLHAHAANAEESSRLGHHLKVYHGDVQSTSLLSWHFHLLLPWERFDWFGCSDEPSPVNDPLSEDGALAMPLESDLILASLSVALCEYVPCDSQLSFATRSGVRPACAESMFASFAESLLLTIPLCAVTGVALC